MSRGVVDPSTGDDNKEEDEWNGKSRWELDLA
jgi:hypothetical protein